MFATSSIPSSGHELIRECTSQVRNFDTLLVPSVRDCEGVLPDWQVSWGVAAAVVASIAVGISIFPETKTRGLGQ